MFARSAAMDTAQGKAIHAVNERWGTDSLARAGRENIGIPVCKKKYKPFHFEIVKKEEDGTVDVTVERMYACKCHHRQRKEVIEKHGVRDGWQHFGVWSMKKAQEMAKLHAQRINDNILNNTGDNNTALEEEVDSDAETTADESALSSSDGSVAVVSLRKSTSNICLNGSCVWKVRSAYDDIYKEIHGESEDEEYDYY
jgi:hypothetical protein